MATCYPGLYRSPPGMILLTDKGGHFVPEWACGLRWSGAVTNRSNPTNLASGDTATAAAGAAWLALPAADCSAEALAAEVAAIAGVAAAGAEA